MRVILTVVTLLILTACATGTQNSISNDKGFDVVSKDTNSKKRVALVIGNKDYQQPFTRLNNTINDARAMKNILETRGFKVIYKTDVTRRGFEESLEKFYRELGASDIGLLYFSGHGLEYNGQNYLIPTDSNIKAKTDTKYEAIALNKVTARMKLENDKLNIVILDACRNDPFAKAMGVGGLAETNPPVGLFVSYATGAGEVSSDGRIGENGLFTKYLIKYIQEPLSFRDVFQKAKEAVYMASNKKQLPAIYNNTINVNFYFTLPDVKKKENNVVVPVTNVTPVANNISDKNSKIWALEKACNLGDGRGCNNLGNIYFTSKNFSKALYFQRKACDLKYNWGCNNIGHAYYWGEGVLKDLSKAKDFYKKACDLKLGSGCHNVGLLYENFIPKNLNKAKEFYKKACDLNYAKGCTKLGNL